MLLPSAGPGRTRVVRIPDDLEAQEAYRFATAIIAQAEEVNREYAWEDIAEALEARGFEVVDLVMGPALD